MGVRTTWFSQAGRLGGVYTHGWLTVTASLSGLFWLAHYRKRWPFAQSTRTKRRLRSSERTRLGTLAMRSLEPTACASFSGVDVLRIHPEDGVQPSSKGKGRPERSFLLYV